MFSLFAAASIVAIIVLLILLQKWNIILKKEVKRRTQELEDSYEGMKNYLDSVLKEIGKTRSKN
jgi:septation ring formation regulator EzrA